VNFISGKKAVLTIYRDGKEQEKVTLSDFNDRDKLNTLFAEKGFEKYSIEEISARRKMKEKEEEEKMRSDMAQARKPEGRMGPRLRKNRHERKLEKKEMRDNLIKLKKARENFMVVGQPRG